MSHISKYVSTSHRNISQIIGFIHSTIELLQYARIVPTKFNANVANGANIHPLK